MSSDAPRARPSQIIRQRVDALGVAEPEITRQGDAIVVNLPGVKDQDRALQLVGQTAELRFRPVLQVLAPDQRAGRRRSTTTVPARRARRRHHRGTTAPTDTTAADRRPPAAARATPAPVPAHEYAHHRRARPTPPPRPPPATPATTVAPTATTVLATTPPENDQADQQVVLPELDSNGNVVRRYLLGPAVPAPARPSVGADAVVPEPVGGQPRP